MNYSEFLDSKRISAQPVGFNPGKLHKSMREDQRDITRWAVQKGRAAAFTDCGTGKSFIEQEWAYQIVSEHGTVLWFAPLAVAEQTVNEGKKWDRKIHLCESQSDVRESAINITNYQKLHKFSSQGMAGIVLDESSILKSLDGKHAQGVNGIRPQYPLSPLRYGNAKPE